MQCDMMSFSKLIRLLTLEYELAYEATGSLSNTSFHHMKCTFPASWNVFDNIRIWNIKPFLNCLQLIYIFIFFFRFLLSTVSYTHLRAHETPEHLVCRLLLEK